MIPIKNIEELRGQIPWQSDAMVEQDMILSRALISMYSTATIRDNLIFRGGTALNKLFLKPAVRYSEDIDLVAAAEGKVGFLMDAIRMQLGWLGKPRTSRDARGFKMLYSFQNVGNGQSKLKIEINGIETFNVQGVHPVEFSMKSEWFTGSASIATYTIEELMATKLRALYQRKKGRDLFDLWHVFSEQTANLRGTIDIFHKYNAYNGIKITKKIFVQNLVAKKYNEDFQQDMRLLLSAGTEWSFDRAFDYVINEVVPLI